MKLFLNLIVPLLLVSSLAIGQENDPVRTFTPEQIYAASGNPYALEFELNNVTQKWVTEKNGMTVVVPDFTLEQKRATALFAFEDMETRIGSWSVIADYVGTVRNHEQKLVELSEVYNLEAMPSFGVLTEVRSDSIAGKKVCAAALTAVYVDGERLTATPLGILKGCGITRTAAALDAVAYPVADMNATNVSPEIERKLQQRSLQSQLLKELGYRTHTEVLVLTPRAEEEGGQR